MDTFIVISFFILGLVFGFSWSDLRRLDKVGKCLRELDIKDPNFKAKIEILRKFNTTF